ncbi:MAG: sigma-54-dependent Fis family transcriptional regulator [Candidatus Abyssobacteria bacterium SURF_5]|uniref:Sigma-54-dependent Fis family transcriptional regulator n=1 Tax=Abyssobacteria bacterium (strain SURF_5) TaxID=2093360 RepID=A0A3A4NJ97_ABYX5|nr:MAG: sigma-54-dependent Fis family transcriptional regulator [Candidatus Abyssubacteria bacterium SURF_5]
MPHEPVKLIVVDDEDAFRAGLCERLERKGCETFGATSGDEALAIASQQLLDVALVDVRMPGMDGIELLSKLRELHPYIEVIILTGVATVATAIEAMKLGAYDYLSKPCNFEELRVLIGKAYEKKRLRTRNLLLERELKRLSCTGEFIGTGPKAMEIREFISRAARADCPVLLEGESGVGKELIAREIYRQSARASGSFVVLDCGSFPETLLANELFGHERGAFTTAIDSRQGLLEMANGGILLIDEIGEMTPANQVALLRVVETNKFRRLGSPKEMQVDVRILASTNRNLREEICRGRFRQDLFYRLDVLHLIVPPLRERKEDIPLLVDYFLACMNSAKGTEKTVTPHQKELLKNHPWPGNVRELANLIERNFFLAPGDQLEPAGFLENSHAAASANDVPSAENLKLADIERDHIIRMLSLKKGNKKETAKSLGISRARLYSLLKRYEILSSPPET